ncbi:MAG: hypothetical protein AMS14_01185 [Planctomycetes bacterium DG_20]|nr:MAG: hypothetical protein AMS14_01185 [Planctomycetes bacterium DG_20]
MQEDWLASPWLVPVAAAAGLVLLGLIALVLATSVYKHVVCLNYLFSGWKAVVPLVSALPAALGVFLLVLVFSIMDGFVRETREMTRGTLSDIIIDAHMEGVPHYEELARRIEAVEGVVAATPVVQTYAVARIKPRLSAVKPLVRPCVVIGIRPGEKADMGRFHEYLKRQRGSQYPSADLLKVPAAWGLGDRPERPGCIAGVGVIGAPMRVDRPDRVTEGTGRRVLAWHLALAAALASVFVWRAASRRPGQSGSRLSGASMGLLWVSLVAAAASLLLREASNALAEWLASQGDAAPATYVRVEPAMRAGVWVLASGGVLACAIGLALTLVGGPLYVVRRLRRGHGEGLGRFVATVLCVVAAFALLGVGVLVPLREVEIMRPRVEDFPLLPYGDDLVVSTIPIRPSGAIEMQAGGIPKVSSRAFAVVDRFMSGYWDADSSHVYVDFDVAQQMAGMDAQPAVGDKPAVPARTNQIQVKIADPSQAGILVERITDVWREFAREKPEVGVLQLTIDTWETQQRMILTVVEVERNITTLMLGVMLLGFGVLIGLISYVMAYIKSRDVGILKALGARDAGVGSLFLGYGLIIGAIGVALGMTEALLMLANLDAIEIWVNQTLGIDVFPREMYYFDHIPKHTSPLWCVGIGAGVLALSTLASMAGGLLAALKQPVEALRYE